MTEGEHRGRRGKCLPLFGLGAAALFRQWHAVTCGPWVSQTAQLGLRLEDEPVPIRVAEATVTGPELRAGQLRAERAVWVQDIEAAQTPMVWKGSLPTTPPPPAGCCVCGGPGVTSW